MRRSGWSAVRRSSLLTCREMSRSASSARRSPVRGSAASSCRPARASALASWVCGPSGWKPAASLRWRGTPLAVERVRYVGEPVAMVWAEDRYRAADLAEAAVVDYAPLPSGTPIHEGAPDDVLLSRVLDAGGVDDAMARADLVIERTFRPARQSAVPLETRGVVAEHDGASGVTTVQTSTQLPHLARQGIASALGVDEASVWVIVPRVGGGFGLSQISTRRRSRWRARTGVSACGCGGSRTGPRISWRARTPTTRRSSCGSARKAPVRNSPSTPRSARISARTRCGRRR